MTKQQDYKNFWPKIEGNPERWGHLVRTKSETEDTERPGHRFKIALSGFASDEGVLRNKGIPGAVEGPRSLREEFSRLAFSENSQPELTDFGDIVCDDKKLEDAQAAMGKLTGGLLKQGYLSLVFGGGHETSLAHFQGIARAIPRGKSLAIINFDAHFDLKPVRPDGSGHSGTPFKQILDWCQANNLPVTYHCLGIQDSFNTTSLFRTAESTGSRYLTAGQIHTEGQDAVQTFLNKATDNADLIYMSICLDVFSSAVAPGVSSVQPLGLFPWQCIPHIRKIATSGKLFAADIVELSPPRDQNHMTARLAACLAMEITRFWTAN